MKNRIGEIQYNNFGSKMEIIDYKKNNDINVYFEEYDWIKYNVAYKEFKNGNIKCPYEPRVCGVGYIGEGKYKSRINGKKTKCYQTWRDMLRRCYDEKAFKKRPTYKDCIVYEEWLNFQNFAEWFEENYYEIEGEIMYLDKDILVKNNKVYSPQTCVFVSNRINVLFTKSEKARGEYPIGVTYYKKYDKFLSSCNVIINNKKYSKNLGYYYSIDEAFQVYKKFKENYIKQVADENKNKIPNKLYKAMYEWEVDIDD